MRELRSCDFCGADAVGTFAVVPPELEPTEAEQRRVVCCGDCKDRLETLLEPLLDRAGADVDVDDRSDGESGGETAGESGDVVASADESIRKRSRTSSPNATVSDADAGTTDSAAADAADDEPPSDSAIEDGISFERNESDESETATATQQAGNGGTSESVDGDVSDEADDASGSQGAATQPPNGYSKVLRLLRNREFPMKRSAVENLAAGAYDLEAHEVDAIVDHAVENGEFVEKRGKLRRP